MPVTDFSLITNLTPERNLRNAQNLRPGRIDAGLEDCLFMGNLEALRDWGRDYVEMQWRMLQQEKPEDFVLPDAKKLFAASSNYRPARWAGDRCNGW